MVTEFGEAVAAEQDFPEVSMFKCDGLECHSNPYDREFIRIERHFFKFLRFGQVGRGFPRMLYVPSGWVSVLVAQAERA